MGNGAQLEPLDYHHPQTCNTLLASFHLPHSIWFLEKEFPAPHSISESALKPVVKEQKEFWWNTSNISKIVYLQSLNRERLSQKSDRNATSKLEKTIFLAGDTEEQWILELRTAAKHQQFAAQTLFVFCYSKYIHLDFPVLKNKHLYIEEITCLHEENHQ